MTESLGSGDLPASGIQIPSSPLTGGGISIDDPCPGFTPITATPVGRPDLTAGNISTSNSEGTAMLEIIHDIAPEAELYFAPGLVSDLEHRRSRRCLTDGVDIIADDISFFNAGPYDGTSAVSLESTNSVLSGVANFIAVGNKALVHYQGIFTDTDGDNFHEFDVSLGLPFMDNSGETLNITFLPLEVVTIFLQWDDSFGASGNDYDLLLVDPADPSSPEEAIVRFMSADPQDGDDNPTEGLFSIINNELDPITVGIVILNFSAETSKEFDMFVSFSILPILDEFTVPQSSVPNNSDADLALSIGSIGLGLGDPLGQGINEIRLYSSRGPTNDGRIKPELVAPDGGSTSVPGFMPFFGTSAAAPHAAGVAALLLEAEQNLALENSDSLVLLNQILSPSDISDILRNTAVDLGPQGTDNTFGSGGIDAFAAVQSVSQQPTPTPTSTPTPTPTTVPTPTTQPPSADSGGGGCSISPPVHLGTASINILTPLFFALAIGFRILRRKR
ncbi:MAG: S8 family serine peptidase [Thermodesulfobacteriota bacterium]